MPAYASLIKTKNTKQNVNDDRKTQMQMQIGIKVAEPARIPYISDTLKELHWLSVEQRMIFKFNLICFKILNNLAPDYLVDLIHVYEPARYLRSSDLQTSGVLLLNPIT